MCGIPKQAECGVDVRTGPEKIIWYTHMRLRSYCRNRCNCNLYYVWRGASGVVVQVMWKYELGLVLVLVLVLTLTHVTTPLCSSVS